MSYQYNKTEYPNNKVEHVKDIPTTPHFALITEDSFSYDDGYGERGASSISHATTWSYYVFTDKQKAMDVYKSLLLKDLNNTKIVLISVQGKAIPVTDITFGNL